jgi:E3 ubiquitin-protein ligase RNF14
MADSDQIARCAESFQDELTVLEVRLCAHLSKSFVLTYQSVYDSLVQVKPSKQEDGSIRMTLEIPITLSDSTTAELSTFHDPDEASPVTPLKLSHLPPIKVNILIPPLYPIFEPPRLVGLEAQVGSGAEQWLDKTYRVEIETRLGQMWSEDKELTGEGSGVIWRWWEWIGSGECLADSGLLKGDVLRYVA